LFSYTVVYLGKKHLMMDSVRLLSAKDIVEERLPDLITGPGATSSEAWHNKYFQGTLGSWKSFEQHARDIKHSMDLDGPPMGCTMENAPLHTEQLACGDEATVEARFQTNIG
jgi:hypothetical protein